MSRYKSNMYFYQFSCGSSVAKCLSGNACQKQLVCHAWWWQYHKGSNYAIDSGLVVFKDNARTPNFYIFRTILLYAVSFQSKKSIKDAKIMAKSIFSKISEIEFETKVYCPTYLLLSRLELVLANQHSFKWDTKVLVSMYICKSVLIKIL